MMENERVGAPTDERNKVRAVMMIVKEAEKLCLMEGVVGLKIRGKNGDDELTANANKSVWNLGGSPANASVSSCRRPGWASGDDDGDGGDKNDPSITFASIGGLDDHIDFIKRSIFFPMKNKESFKLWGMEPPKGILFHGPPGTGKTLLAKAIANELNGVMGNKKVTFFYHKGTESFSKWFGETEENLRDLFQRAKNAKPSIIFFDEIDGLCPDRDVASDTSEAYVGVVTALLGMMDEINRGEIFLIGSTNRMDSIDAAIKRPGRFDNDLLFSHPDLQGRKFIIKIHTSKWFTCKPEGELLDHIGNLTNGYSGADLEKLAKDAFSAAKERCGKIPVEDITVLQQDWEKAANEMKPSCSDVFGATLFTPSPPLPITLPLITNMVIEVVRKICPLLPELSTNKFLFEILGLRSFLIWEKELDYELFLHHVLMNGILSHPVFSKIKKFSLTIEHLVKKAEEDFVSPLKTVLKIVKQVQESKEPCILYVPGINEINDYVAAYSGEQNHFAFVRTLHQLGGTNGIIIATAIGQKRDISNEVLGLFDGLRTAYKVRFPTREEREYFFGQIFEDLIIEQDPAKRAKMTENQQLTPNISLKFETHLMNSVNLTANHPCDYLLRLYEAFRKEKVKTKNYEELEANFSHIVDMYDLNRLKDD